MCGGMTAAIELQTRRLLVRRYRPEDAAALHACLRRSRGDVARWVPMPGATPPVEELAARLGGRHTMLAIFARAGALVGTAVLEPMDEPRVTSIGYWLDVEQRGHGYATEAVAALARACLELLGAVRVEIYCHPDNERSARVPRRLGFERLGHARVRADGALLDRWALRDPQNAARWAPALEVRDAGGKVLAAPRPEAAALVAWVPLCRYVSAHLAPSEVTASRMVVPWPTPAGTVEVTAAVGEACGRPWLVVTAPVSARIDPIAALARNAELAIGALVLDGQRLVLRHAGPLEDTPGWKLRQTMELLAHEAARLGEARRTPDARAFERWAD